MSASVPSIGRRFFVDSMILKFENDISMTHGLHTHIMTKLRASYIIYILLNTILSIK